LNELLNSVKAGEKAKIRSLLKKVGALLLSGTAVASGLTTIADSYISGGIAQQFIGRVIKYTSL
jgi:hypothetical protein